MVNIKILLENSSVNEQCESAHGLSVFIKYNNENILLDTGPDNKFIKNAKLMGVDLTSVNYLFLSHNHYDHTGGINDFIEVNNSASVYIMDDINNRYYKKKYFIPVFIGTKLDKKYYSRVNHVKEDLIINNKIYFLKNTATVNEKPTANKALFKKEKGRIVNDTFDHEGILVLEDNNELLIFDSCSHNGVLNIIETVKTKIPDKLIRSYTGGLHLSNPGTEKHENHEYLDYLIKQIKNMNIRLYTGHCTGRFALDYMKEKLGDMMQEINTGMELSI